MAEAANQLTDMIQNRLTNRRRMLESLSGSPLDNVPDEVKKMREVESYAIRAVIQEQSDIIEIIRMLYPQNTPDAGATKG